MEEREPERRVAKYDAAIVVNLADDFDLPLAQIADVYERRLAYLEDGARVKSFVPIIAAHQVRLALIQHRDQRHPANSS